MYMPSTLCRAHSMIFNMYWKKIFGLLFCIVLEVSSAENTNSTYEYVFALMEIKMYGTDQYKSSIHISNPYDESVSVVGEWGINSWIGVLDPYTFNKVPINFHLSGSKKDMKALVFKSNASLPIYVLSGTSLQSDLFRVPEMLQLDTSYMAMTHCTGNQHMCECAVVGMQKNTKVTFTFTLPLTYNSKIYKFNESLTINVDKHETFQLQSSEDMSGLRISSDAPVAAFCGAARTHFRSASDIYTGDSLSKWLPPLNKLGTDYIVASINNQPNYLKIVRSSTKVSNVTVKYVVNDDEPKTTIHKTDSPFKTEILRLSCSLCRLISTVPVLVSHFIEFNSLHDTGMYIALPVNEFKSEYHISYIPNSLSFCKLCFFISFESIDGEILLNNEDISSKLQWDGSEYVGYKTASSDVDLSDTGRISLYHTKQIPFGGYMLCADRLGALATGFSNGENAVVKDPSIETTTKTTSTPSTETITITTSTPSTDTITKTTSTPSTETITITTSTPSTDTITKTTSTPSTDTITKTTSASAIQTNSDTTIDMTHKSTTGMANGAEQLTAISTTEKTTTEVSWVFADNPSTISSSTAKQTGTGDTDPGISGYNNLCGRAIPQLANVSVLELRHMIKQLRQQLVINKVTLSKYKGKKTSAMDDRQSSKLIGVIGTVVIVVVVVCFMALDAGRVIDFFIKCKHQKSVGAPQAP